MQPEQNMYANEPLNRKNLRKEKRENNINHRIKIKCYEYG
jgi:hypothetical protein